VTRDATFRLGDLVARIDAIAVAEGLLRKGEAQGDRDLAGTAFDAILYDLLVIGEAVRSLPQELRDSEPGVPWSGIVGMRNVIAHEYFRIRSEVISTTIDEPLAMLRGACERLLRS
jgi:uncharacterized protein with HEPN domain